MKIRKNFLPRTIPDVAASLFLTLCIPLTFWFEVFVVLPEFHNVGSFFYCFTFLVAIFIVFNITSNLMAIMLIDTTIKGEMLSAPDEPEARKLWRFCSVCETIAPPRSWHCVICKTCILKRDHHCTFSGCCIGHRNHRYFFMMLTFLFIGTIYSTIYNSIYFWWLHSDQFLSPITLLKMTCPGMILFFGPTRIDWFITIYELNAIGVIFSLFLLLFHGNTLTTGSVLYERRTAPKYDLGLKTNIEMVFGQRWYLAWLSPFIQSELPHDGIHWEQMLLDTPKTK